MNKLLSGELSYFKILPPKARKLIFSYSFRSVAYPILSIFINAFIWRSTGSVWNVVLYNLGFFVALPIGFFTNALLLKRVKITKSYFLGLILSVVSALSVVFFSGSNWEIFLTYGLIYGFGSGIYWSCRNYLTFQETNTAGRNYFFSITSIIETTANIGISFIAGWAIIFGEVSGLYTPTTAYWIFVLLAFFFIILSGFVLWKLNYTSPTINKIWQPHISKKWTVVRIVNFGMGFLEGSKMFLPAILILIYLGKEGILGTITATVSLITIILFYIYGRLAKPHHRKSIFILAVVTHFLLATFLAFGNSNFNVLFYVVLGGIPMAFYWLTMDPWLLDMMDKEVNNNKDKKFMLVCDQELFLNMGRVSSVMVLFFVYILTSEVFALQTTPLILALGQVAIMGLAWRKMKLDTE